MNSADAEAYIRSQRESRQEFEKNEGKPLYEHDEEMNRLHKQHADIGEQEAQRQREFSEKQRADQQDQQKQQQDHVAAAQAEQSAADPEQHAYQGRSM